MKKKKTTTTTPKTNKPILQYQKSDTLRKAISDEAVKMEINDIHAGTKEA